MRILFLTQTYPRTEEDTSGPFIRDLARALVRGGDEVTVLAPRVEGLSAGRDSAGVEVRTFRYASRKWEVLGYSRSLDRDESMKMGALAVTPLYLWGGRRALKKLLREQTFDLVQAHWILPNGLIGTVSRRVPLAIGLHGSSVFLAEKPFLRPLPWWILRHSSVLTGCSPELVDRVCALGFSKDRSRVIPYGVDTVKFSPGSSAAAGKWRARLGIPAAAPMILSVGRMATKKGYQHLMPILGRLFEAVPEAHVVLAGGGDRLEEFRRLAEPWSRQVHFPGAVQRDTLPDLYRAADLFVLPAVHDPKGNVDGLPNVILEAMASGLPVVASGISGIPLAITDGVHGRLVPEKDSEALLAALANLLSDHEALGRAGAAARLKVETDLTWDAVAARYRQAYELALKTES